MWTEPVFCNENDEGKICSFSPKTCQVGYTGREESVKYVKLKNFEENRIKKVELKAWIIQKIKELKQSAFEIGSDCVARFGHCAETYAVYYFANFFLKKPNPQVTASLPLCGVAMRLDGLKAAEFTFESIVGIENISDQ